MRNQLLSDDAQRLDLLSNLTLDKLEQLLDFFKVRYKNIGGRIFGPCPVHNGKNPHAFNIYCNSGIWQCFTQHCETKKGKTLVGLVRALLSRDLDKKFIDNKQLIEFLTDFTNANLAGLRSDPYYKDKKDFAQQFNKTEQKVNVSKTDRAYIRSKLVIPAEYYIKRGYSTEVLNEFDIGTCLNANLPMFGRVIVPIYDDENNFIGCTSRSTDNSLPKWQDSANLPKDRILYNYWRVKTLLKEKISVGPQNLIICESPGNLWRIWEAGFKLVVATLGTAFTARQFDLINKLEGIDRLIIVMDNDEAGRKASTTIENISKKLYNITNIDIRETPLNRFNDVGEMTTGQVKELFNYFKVF